MVRQPLVLGAIGLSCIGIALGGINTTKPVKKVNYAEHVAPILNRSCVPCHRPNEVAPFSLIGYDNAKKWARMIAKVSDSRLMPPWKAEHGYGEFQDENRLTNSEIATLKAWVGTGAERGDKKKEPKLVLPASDWTLGQPDMIVSPSKAFKLDAEGDDVYRNFVIKTNSDQPIWVKAMDVHPGNRKVVHHVIVFVDNNGMSDKLAAKTTDGQEGYVSQGGGVGFLPSGALGGWAPGLRPIMNAQGTAFKVNPGARLVVQVHYHKSGKPEEDLTKVGLYVAKEPIDKEIHLAWIMNFGLNIPAGESDYKIARNYKVPTDVTLRFVLPHMHLLGRKMEAHVVLPDGSEKPLIKVNDWDFNWQLMYAYKEPIKIPKGSTIVVNAQYDNSANNLRNPNSPPKRVTWGEQTTDEMFLLVAGYTRD